MSEETNEAAPKVGPRARVAMLVAITVSLLAAFTLPAMAVPTGPIPVTKTLTGSDGSTVTVSGTVDFNEQGQVAYDLTVSPASSGILGMTVAGNPASLQYGIPVQNGKVLGISVGQGYAESRSSNDVVISNYGRYPTGALFK